MSLLHVTESSALAVPVLGTVTKFLLTARDTGGQFTHYRISAPAGAGVPLHLHQREDETFLIRAGRVKFTVAGREVIAAPGDVVFGPRGVAHGWTTEGDAPCEFDVIATPSGMETMFQELGALTPGSPMPEVLAICARAEITFG